MDQNAAITCNFCKGTTVNLVMSLHNVVAAFQSTCFESSSLFLKVHFSLSLFHYSRAHHIFWRTKYFLADNMALTSPNFTANGVSQHLQLCCSSTTCRRCGHVCMDCHQPKILLARLQSLILMFASTSFHALHFYNIMIYTTVYVYNNIGMYCIFVCTVCVTE